MSVTLMTVGTHRTVDSCLAAAQITCFGSETLAKERASYKPATDV